MQYLVICSITNRLQSRKRSKNDSNSGIAETIGLNPLHDFYDHVKNGGAGEACEVSGESDGTRAHSVMPFLLAIEPLLFPKLEGFLDEGRTIRFDVGVLVENHHGAEVAHT
jgi:hypothetical protein